MGKLRRQRGGVLFVEGTGQLKLEMTVRMSESHGTAMLALNAGAADLPVNPLEAKLKMKSQTVVVSCQLLEFILQQCFQSWSKELTAGHEEEYRYSFITWPLSFSGKVILECMYCDFVIYLPNMQDCPLCVWTGYCISRTNKLEIVG